jgi:hypothetical protein
MTINNTPETRAFLSVLEAMDGSATMADVRKRTGLNEDKRHYQFKKLEKAGIISVEYNEWGGTSTAPMKEAQLTEFGEELLESGFLNEETSEFQRANVDVVELADNMDTYDDFVRNTVYPELERLTNRVVELEAQLSEPESTNESTPSEEEDEGLAYARRIGLVEEGTDKPIR